MKYASVVRFVTFTYFAVAQTLINKLSPRHKKTPHQGNGVPLVTTASRFNSASVVRFVTFAYFAIAQTLINKLSPHHKKNSPSGEFFLWRALDDSNV